MTARVRNVVFLVVALAYAFLGHLDWWPGNGVWGRPRGFEIERPFLTGGDEPFYMMMVHSLLEDGDLRLDDEYEKVRKGGVQAGNTIKGFDIEGHSILVNPRTHKHTKCFVKCTPAEIAAVDGQPGDPLFKVSAHPAAYPALMALMTLPFRPKAEEIDPLIGTFSIVIALIGIFLTYVAARSVRLSERAAIGAMLIAGFASPWLVYMRSYFSEEAIGVSFLLGFMALRRDRAVLAGIAVGVAMAMKPVFVLVGVAWILERAWARRWRTAFLLAASVGVCGVAILVVNHLTIHVPLATGAIEVGWAHDFKSLWDTFFEREHGLFVFVPWSIAAVGWAFFGSRSSAADRDDLMPVDARRQILLAFLVCLAVFASLAFGPSWCWGPRYYVPFMPLLALLVVDWLVAERTRVTKALFAFLVAAGALISILGTPGYHWLFGQEPFATLRGPVAP